MLRTTAIFGVCVLLGLSACGGGGGDSKPAPTSSAAVSSVVSSLSSSRPSSSSSSSSSSSISSSSSTAVSSSSMPAVLVVKGLVVDDLALPIEGALVSEVGANQQVTTLADGTFSMELSTSVPAVLRVEKAGYSGTVKAAEAPALNPAIAARIVMPRVLATLTFDPTQEAVLRVPGSVARVDLPTASLVDSNGQPVTGEVTAQLTPIDPSKDIALMPGLMVDATFGGAIESLGAMGVDFKDANGKPLNLGAGKTASIRIPATPAAGAALPETFPLYHLNETSGLWEQEGTASLQADPVTGSKYYEGTVSHFSWWNADQLLTRSAIDLSATIDGALCALPEGTQVFAFGVDYNGASGAVGNSLPVRQNSRVRVELVSDGFAVDSLELTSPTAGGTVRMPRCLANLPTVTLSGHVTVSSGVLNNYRVQISGDLIKTVTLPIRADGSYSWAVPANRGAVRARLVAYSDLGTPDTEVTTTVAAVNASFPDLIVQDTRFALSGCVQGWPDYRQATVQVSVFRGTTQIAESKTLQNTGSGKFTFGDLPFNTTLTLRLTPPSAKMAEKDIPLVVAGEPATLTNCLVLPIAPYADMQVSGTGLSRSFDSVGSTAGEGRRIVSTHWNFGDGSTATGAATNHTFAAAGSYEVVLQITDDVNQVTQIRRTVELVEADQTLTTLTPTTALAAGVNHTCAVRAGGVWCWGTNYAQQLGSMRETVIEGDTIIESGLMSSGVPLQISGLSNVTAVAAGDSHTCVLHAKGTVSCWGAGENGQLGNNSSSNSILPVPVSNLTSAVAIGTGSAVTCALLQDSSVQCWGGVEGGNKLVPTPVLGLNGVKALSVGRAHRCAVLMDGTVRCWGDNDDGQLGNNTKTDSATPVEVFGISTAVAVVAGMRHSCALLADGTVNCWGYRGISGFGGTVESGLMGDGVRGVTPALTPVQVSGISTAKALATGYWHTCALLQDNTLTCWGGKGYARGQSNPNSIAFSPVPLGVSGAVNAIALGESHTCMSLATGAVQCLGDGYLGRLGTGGQSMELNPSPSPYPDFSITPLQVLGLP